MTEAAQSWIFSAKVLPERASISLRGLSYGVEVESDLGFRCRFEKVAIIDSQIIARVTLLEGTTDVYTLRNALAQHLRNLADLVGFLTGRRLDVEITSAVSTSDPDNWVIFGNTIPILFKESADLTNAVLQVALTDSQMAMALADFRKSMPDGTETGFYCYRAIESVMQFFRQDGANDATHWSTMRLALNIDRSAIDYIKAHADDRRHGRPSNSITDAQRQKIFRITHAVLDRYLNFRVASTPTLDAATYPLITDTTF